MLNRMDFRVDTFKYERVPGKFEHGGVKVTHLPTGLCAESTKERSQVLNYKEAMKRLLKDDQFVNWLAIQIIEEGRD